GRPVENQNTTIPPPRETARLRLQDRCLRVRNRGRPEQEPKKTTILHSGDNVCGDRGTMVAPEGTPCGRGVGIFATRNPNMKRLTYAPMAGTCHPLARASPCRRGADIPNH